MSCQREEEDRYAAHLLRELQRLSDPPVGGISKYQGIARLLSLLHSVIPLALALLHPLAFLKRSAPSSEKVCRAAFHLPPRCP